VSGAADAVRDAWAASVVAVGGGPDVARESAAELVAEDTNRRYHDLAHIRDVLARVAELVGPEATEDLAQAALVLAACAHDVVYSGRPGDDERASAAWAGGALLRAGSPPELIARVQALVLVTIDHVAPPGDDAAARLVDADLAVLGSDPRDYAEYVAAVRTEYAWVSDDDWSRGRAAVLNRLLAREPLYVTAAARQRWEAAARVNLSRELAALAPR
jgi:predicted metal-dependent HD superfamily phosphohydrolase